MSSIQVSLSVQECWKATQALHIHCILPYILLYSSQLKRLPLTLEVYLLTGQSSEDRESEEHSAGVQSLVAAVQLSQSLLDERDPQLLPVSLSRRGREKQIKTFTMK